jgi:hypothetical protein
MLNFVMDKSRVGLQPEKKFALLKEPLRPADSEDWLGNPIYLLTKPFSIAITEPIRRAKLSIMKDTLAAPIEYFDTRQGGWTQLVERASLDESYFSVCGDHLFFDLPVQDTYAIRSSKPVKALGVLIEGVVPE